MVAKDPNIMEHLYQTLTWGWTEFHCNNCGKLIGFLNSIDENIYDTIEDELLLCTNCICNKEMNMKEQNTIVK